MIWHWVVRHVVVWHRCSVHRMRCPSACHWAILTDLIRKLFLCRCTGGVDQILRELARILCGLWRWGSDEDMERVR